MGRVLCQKCNSIVYPGDYKHPCFCYRNDDEVYTVPPPNELERRHEETEGTHTGISNDSEGSICEAAEQKDYKESKETNSMLIENNEQISPILASRRKTSSAFPSKFLSRMRYSNSGSKQAGCSTVGKNDNEAETNNSKKNTKIKSASDELSQIDDSANSAMTANSAMLRSAADPEVVPVAGPSGIKTHSKRSGKKKVFECDVCGKVFGRKHNLIAHSRTHTGEKPFACPTCNRRFNLKAHLMSHLLTHTGEKPFACPKCGKKFAWKQNLKAHLRTHSGEKPHTCHVCNKAFAQKRNLVYHVRTHTEAKPFTCKFCGKGFVNQSNCNWHERRKHGEK